MTNAPSGRILILGDYPPPFGGIATHLRGLVPALEDAGYGVDIVSPGKADGRESLGRCSTVHRVSKDRSVNLGKLAKRPFSFLKFVGDARVWSPEIAKGFVIREVAREIFAEHGDAVRLISAYMVHPWGFAGAFLAREFGRPLVTTNFGELFQFRGFYRAHRTIAKRVVRDSAVLLASSRHCGRMYETSLGLGNVAVEVVPYGVESSFFETAASCEDARAKEQLPGDKFLVMFLGRMNAEMGLDTWLESVRELAPTGRFHFLIAGAAGDLTPVVQEAAARWPDRITVRVNAPFEALPRYYAASNLVVAPSADERTCMGVTIKEAMAAGRAVLASDVGGIGEAVVPGETGLLVEPGRADAFASAVVRMAEEPARLQEMGRRGRERALELFTMEGTHRRLIAIMERAMRVHDVAPV